VCKLLLFVVTPGHVTIPVLVVHSGEDEYALHIDKKKITGRLLDVFTNEKSKGIIIDGNATVQVEC
jgi:hypothetical protein